MLDFLIAISRRSRLRQSGGLGRSQGAGSSQRHGHGGRSGRVHPPAQPPPLV